MYSENFRASPTPITKKAIRPSTALKLSGTHDLTTGYRMVKYF